MVGGEGRAGNDGFFICRLSACLHRGFRFSISTYISAKSRMLFSVTSLLWMRMSLTRSRVLSPRIVIVVWMLDYMGTVLLSYLGLLDYTRL